jgi:hypothetical protein
VPKRNTQKKSAWGPSQASEPDHGHEKRRKLHRRASSGSRDIGDPGSESFMHFRIAIRDFPIGGNNCQSRRTGGRLCDGERTVDRSTTMSHRGSGNCESGGRVLVDIANHETPMESMVEDMW